MSELSTSLVQQFQQMSRAVQWAVLAAIGLVLFLIWDQAIGPVTDDLNRRAESISTKVNELRAGEEVARKLNAPDVRDLAVSLGPVDPPPAVGEGETAFLQLINKLVVKHAIPDHDSTFRPRGKLQKTALMSIAHGKRVEQLTCDLKFTASPKATAAFIADLESDPAVQAVTSVRLVRDTPGKLKVTLTIEAWVLSSETPKGAA